MKYLHTYLCNMIIFMNITPPSMTPTQCDGKQALCPMNLLLKSVLLGSSCNHKMIMRGFVSFSLLFWSLLCFGTKESPSKYEYNATHKQTIVGLAKIERERKTKQKTNKQKSYALCVDRGDHSAFLVQNVFNLCLVSEYNNIQIFIYHTLTHPCVSMYICTYYMYIIIVVWCTDLEKNWITFVKNKELKIVHDYDGSVIQTTRSAFSILISISN